MKKLKITLVITALMSFAAVPASAETAPGFQAVPAPPSPPPVQSGEQFEPQITIIQRRDHLVHEYRVRGRLYQIKIVPKGAPPYFLVDVDGDGRFETRMHELGTNFLVPHWVLFSW